jgi:RNA polymerase sigma-B factor
MISFARPLDRAESRETMPSHARTGEPDALLAGRWRSRRDEQARAMLAERYDPLAHGLAFRFVSWGEPLDDLVQVARLAVLKCIDRFEPERGLPFATYATPVVVGELRRHFRDRTAPVHVPRSVFELRGRVQGATDVLTRSLGRPPTIPELAARLEVTVEDVLEAIQSARASIAIPLEPEDDSEAPPLPVEERGYGEVDLRLALHAAMRDFDDRDRAILALRFGDGLSQAAIGKRLGISQMHVSRLLRRASERLRAELETSLETAGR